MKSQKLSARKKASFKAAVHYAIKRASRLPKAAGISNQQIEETAALRELGLESDPETQ